MGLKRLETGSRCECLVTLDSSCSVNRVTQHKLVGVSGFRTNTTCALSFLNAFLDNQKICFLLFMCNYCRTKQGNVSGRFIFTDV
jgi:hypothetical protein